MILVLGSDAGVKYASPSVSQVLGYEVADLVDRWLLDYIPDADQALVESALLSLLARTPGPSDALEFRIRHGDGHLLHTEACSPTCWPTPRLAGSWSTCGM